MTARSAARCATATGGDDRAARGRAARGRSVVILDDMASTGHTVAQAARLLLAAGAASVDVAVTHALFAEGPSRRRTMPASARSGAPTASRTRAMWWRWHRSWRWRCANSLAADLGGQGAAAASASPAARASPAQRQTPAAPAGASQPEPEAPRDPAGLEGPRSGTAGRRRRPRPGAVPARQRFRPVAGVPSRLAWRAPAPTPAGRCCGFRRGRSVRAARPGSAFHCSEQLRMRQRLVVSAFGCRAHGTEVTEHVDRIVRQQGQSVKRRSSCREISRRCTSISAPSGSTRQLLLSSLEQEAGLALFIGLLPPFAVRLLLLGPQPPPEHRQTAERRQHR